MSTSYVRCKFESSDTKEQCNSWYDSDLTDSSMCEIHREIASLSGISFYTVTTTPEKQKYIDFVNAQHSLCVNMSLDELDEHIKKIEAVIENERTKLLAARATKSQKLESLSDAERAARRKQTISNAVRESKPKQTKPQKVTLKENPVKYMMQSFGFSQDESLSELGLSLEDAKLKGYL